MRFTVSVAAIAATLVAATASQLAGTGTVVPMLSTDDGTSEDSSTRLLAIRRGVLFGGLDALLEACNEFGPRVRSELGRHEKLQTDGGWRISVRAKEGLRAVGRQGLVGDCGSE